MTLVNDLGMQLATPSAKTKRRYGMYECPTCKCVERYNTHKVTSGRKKECSYCATGTRAIKKTTHGETHSRLYNIHQGMKSRCYNINVKAYPSYGGSGVIVCNEWLEDYTVFRSWALSNGYLDTLSIDRIDGKGNYDPSNCRWATHSVQSSNTVLLRENNTTGYRGVSVFECKFKASITVEGTSHYLGLYNSAELAGEAYDNYIIDNKLDYKTNKEVE